jgi:hypothetical protein
MGSRSDFGLRGARFSTGGGRGRGRWRGNISRDQEARRDNKSGGNSMDNTISVPLDDLLEVINLKDVQGSAQIRNLQPTIENVETIGSFNWLAQRDATILVPGPFRSCQCNHY